MKAPLTLLSLLCLCLSVSGQATDLDELRKKAEAGDLESQALLGSHYYLDLADGVAAQKQAVKWLRAAGEQGDAPSQYFLGRIFATGCPEQYFRKDDEEAVKW